MVRSNTISVRKSVLKSLSDADVICLNLLRIKRILHFTIEVHKSGAEKRIEDYYREVYLVWLSSRQPFCLSERNQFGKLGKRRHKKYCTRDSDNHPRSEARNVVVIPDSQKSQGPVNGHRNQSQKEPDASRRIDSGNLTEDRIRSETRQKPKIDSEAAGAHCEREFAQMKRSGRHLVTEVTVESVDVCGNRRISELKECGCRNYDDDPDQRDSCRNRPDSACS